MGVATRPSGSERETPAIRRARARVTASGGLALSLAVLGLATMGFNTTRIAGWTVSDLIFLLSAAVICAKLLGGRIRDLAPPSMRKTSPVILIGTLALVIAGAVTSLQSFTPVDSILMVVRLAWITLAWFWVMRSVAPNRDTLRKLLRGVRVMVLISCAGAVIGYFGLAQITPPNPENREAAFFNHPNELGGMLAMIMPLAVLGALQGRGRRADSTARRLAFVGFIVFAMTTTGSMTSILSTVVGMVTLVVVSVLTRTKGKRRFSTPLPYFAAGIVLAGTMAWMASSDLPVVERFTQLGEGGGEVEKSVGARGELNDYILNNLDDFLVVGVGLDANTANVVQSGESATRVHNMYLKLIYEAGIPSLLGLVAIILTALRQAWRLMLNTRGDELNPLARGLFAAVVSGSFFALFQPLFAQRYYWLPVALIGVLWALRREEAREARDAATLVPQSALPRRAPIGQRPPVGPGFG